MSEGDNPLPLRVTRDGGADGQRLTKQRAVYSETLGKSTAVARSMVDNGPQWANKDVARNPGRQQAPPLRGFNKTAPGGMGSTSGGKKRSPRSLAPLQQMKGMVKPKVIIPYAKESGKLPRRLEVERKTRIYADQGVDELLRESGIDYSKYGVAKDHETGENSFLALEIFDDRAFEVRSAEDWIAEGTNDEGKCSIDGRGLRTDPAEGTGQFEPCQVVGFDRSANRFVVHWETDEDGETALLSRINLNFLAEDPFSFASAS
jgi:hypothetical protein